MTKANLKKEQILQKHFSCQEEELDLLHSLMSNINTKYISVRRDPQYAENHAESLTKIDRKSNVNGPE